MNFSSNCTAGSGRDCAREASGSSTPRPSGRRPLIQNLHPGLKRKVRDALEQILADPHSGKALKDELEGLRSFRVGRFRIVYRIATGRRIDLVAVGPRAIIYEETYRRIAKTLRLSGE